ncbi:hypothetical protein Poli38472_009696 [Pythium oligandrum]|uniref:DnaJ homologue subfamily C GRV2/DNAJC13 N-terminal domain-containing protein n=1 Tax=Pythium oligandrum TaxID=41045 RepID=A0A8K1FL00_PYTOL|nr:hypothetical protein Poli38472_009696 [Pythium oligandrum]|eukprot:TMW62203.1 hypothetical protein Poli38472_009696 [Pythium oligandrum]
MTDAELQRLKQAIEPVVLGPQVVALDDGYVPRGPETLHGVETENTNGTRDDEPDIVDIGTNRYTGLIYAARFFVTRVGFFKSVRRIMVLSSHHMTIVDPYTDEVKERYAYDNIKEITVASDSGGGYNNVDRSFTIFIGKNIKESYTCRYRQQLLSAYYQLRERASSYRREALETAGPAVNMLPGMVAPTGIPALSIPGANPAGANGMYFDSLFQLCGKTFSMTKLSSTQSTSLKPVRLDVCLAVRATSLDRLHPESRATLSSILLVDIVKIQRVTTNSTELLVYFENNRVHRYWCDAREPFIQAIANNLRSWLNVSLFVEEVSDSCEFDALTSTRDIPQPVSFEIPVFKISKNTSNKLQLRLLALTSTAVLERDPETRRTLATHPLSDIFNVVMYPSMSPSLGNSVSESEGTHGKFALELKHGRTRRFVCVSSTVAGRDKEVGLGLTRSTPTHDEELRTVLSDIAGETAIPSWLKVAGSSTLLSPKEARSLFLCNMIEMCRMNKLHVSWSTEETRVACKEGTWGSEVHPELEDIFLRKLVNLNLIPNLVTKDSLEQIFRQLEQFNRNIPVGTLRQRDRRAFASLMKLLENFKEYAVAQLTSPSNSDSPVPTAEFQVAILLAIQRLLCTRAVFEEVPNAQYKKAIEIIMELLHSPMEEVSFAAASVIKYMVINYSETRSMKSETVNRRAVFTKYHCKLFVSRAFDLSKANRVGRVPRQNLLQYRAGSVDKIKPDGSHAERSMTSALSYSQMGLDYLVLSLVLQTLEVCLSSGKKASPERVVSQLLGAMRIDEFMRHHTLFLFNRSLSFSIAKCSSILVKVHVLEQPSELVELIQDFARKHGALLWQLYMSLYAQDKAQRRISSQLVALLTHENPRSSAVIRSVFPHALLDDIPVDQLEYDEFGRQLPAFSSDMIQSKSNTSFRKRRFSSIVEDATNATESGRSKLSYGINTRARLVKNAKCVVLLPEFFDRLWKSYSTKDLMWGPNAVEELVRKLEAELAHLDIFRLRYQYYLYTDPLGGNKVDNSWDLTEAIDQDRQTVQQPYPFEFLHTGSESRLALEVMRGTVSSSNKFAQYMPLSFLLNPDTSDGADSEEGGDDNGDGDDSSGDEGSGPPPPPPPAGRRSSLNPTRDYLATKSVNQEAAHAVAILEQKVKKKRRKKARSVPRWYVSWNANEFRVDYDTLQDEVKVGPYYLTNLLNDRGILVEDIDGAEKFMNLLYYRLLAEDEVEADPAGHAHTTDLALSNGNKSDIRLLVLKVMIQVFERHFSELGSLSFLNHFLRVSMIQGGSPDNHQWPLVVRGNIMLLLDRVLSSAINVARFLREEDNVNMILDLLREVKPLVQAEDSIEEEAEYVAEESDDEAELGGDPDEYDDDEEDEGDFESAEDDGESIPENESDYEEARGHPTLSALEASLAESSLVTSPTLSPSHFEQPESTQRRFTVVAEHSGSMSPSMIMQTCLSVLSRLIDCHTASDEGNMFQDVKFPKYGRLIHFEGSAVSPASSIKNRLCEDQTLRFIVSLLDCPNRVVFKKCLGLIRLLVRHNEAIIPKLHATGLFYYLLRFAQDSEDMSVAARLMSHVHLRQSRPDVVYPAHDRQGGENKKGIFSPDPLTRICSKSWLVRLLPVSMVAQLLRHGPRRFAQALFSDSNNPEVVWNAKMRSQMVSYIEKFMARHSDAEGMFKISGDAHADHNACVALIEYPKEVHALQCYQYYLHNLLDEKHFPGWPINEEAAFLEALMDAINYWVHPEKTIPSRNGSTSEAKVLSISDAILLLDSAALLLRRFPESPALVNFNNLVYILEALEKCIQELRDNGKKTVRGTLDISHAVKRKTEVIRAFASAVRVINLATALSEENSIDSSSALGVRVLCSGLHLLFHNQEILKELKDFDVQVTTHWILEALVNVLNQPNGRVSAATQSLDLLPCLTHYLSQDEDRLATDLSLQIIYEMATSHGEMAEVLLLQIAEHGILWYLSLLLFRYRSTAAAPAPRIGSAGENSSDVDRISIGAAKALEQILLATAKEETIAVFVKRMQDTIECVFTRPLIDILRKNGPVMFLDVLVSEVREPHVMWTERMRRESIDIAQRAVQFHSTVERSGREFHRVYELPNHFMYAAQKEELCVAGIYVNYFNENPQVGVHEQIAGTQNPIIPNIPEKTTAVGRRGKKTAATASPPERSVSAHVVHGLLLALAHDLAGVRAQPSALEAVLLNRMLPVATAIRHLIQFTADIDIQVVQSDGILTLLSVLDHEAQPHAFSFANAPLLQLRCIECLHMLSFSGKCLDSLATQVPPFVKSIFQIVYKNLSKTDASTEGQLARITLQFLGNLCLIPACVDNMVKGMDPVDLSNLLPQVWLGDPSEVQLLLCLHMIPLKRHTQAATHFAKSAVNSQLAASLLNLLSSLVPKSKLGESTQTKSYAARFLSVLSSNPGSGGAISSLLVSSRPFHDKEDVQFLQQFWSVRSDRFWEGRELSDHNSEETAVNEKHKGFGDVPGG